MQELGPACMVSICTHGLDARGHRAGARINISRWLTLLSQQYTLVHISKVTPVVQLTLFLKYFNSLIWICGYARHSKNVYTKPLRESLAVKLSTLTSQMSGIVDLTETSN